MIQEHIDLLPYNTFQVSCVARYFVVVNTEEDFQELIATDLWKRQEKKLFLGGGSNMLLVSPTYDGIVVKNEIMGKINQKPEIRNQNTEEGASGAGTQYFASTIRVGAGENRDQFVYRSIEQGYHGIENLVSVPGTVGASPVQNIGAYGIEVESLIYRVEGIHVKTGKKQVFTHAECEFGYRDSVFKRDLKGDFFITHVIFRLQKFTNDTYTPLLNYGDVADRVERIKQGESIMPHDVATAIAQIRSEKLPDWKKLGTAGSFFKNPMVSEEKYLELEKEFGIKGWKVEIATNSSHSERSEESHKLDSIDLTSQDSSIARTSLNLSDDKNEDAISYSPSATSQKYKLSAGQLIDLAGLKGYRHGEIGVYENHALVLVNYGEKDGSKFLELIGVIQEKVNEMVGVMLEPEVNML